LAELTVLGHLRRPHQGQPVPDQQGAAESEDKEREQVVHREHDASLPGRAQRPGNTGTTTRPRLKPPRRVAEVGVGAVTSSMASPG